MRKAGGEQMRLLHHRRSTTPASSAIDVDATDARANTLGDGRRSRSRRSSIEYTAAEARGGQRRGSFTVRRTNLLTERHEHRRATARAPATRTAALKLLQQQVRGAAADAKLRVFLFQLLCVLGQWQRALDAARASAASSMPARWPMVNTYREAMQCEARARGGVRRQDARRMLFGQPAAWVAPLIEALQADARGEPARPRRLRADALEQAPATPGRARRRGFRVDRRCRLAPRPGARGRSINGRYGWLPFVRLAQRHDRAAGTTCATCVWAPAHLAFANGGDTVALIPTRYAGRRTAATGPAVGASHRLAATRPTISTAASASAC